MLTNLSAVLACLATSLPHATSPTPDIIPEGRRPVPVVTRTELAPLLNACCVQHVAVEGDTIAKLAAQRLGDPERASQILSLNPDLETRNLQIGQRIWLPPLQASVEAPWRFAFQMDRYRGMRSATALAATDTLRSRYGAFAVVLVPAELREAFVEATRGTKEEVTAFAKEHHLEEIPGHNSNSMVPDGSEVARIESVIKMLRDEAGRFSFKTETISYDKDDKIIQPAGEGKKGSGAWILLLAVAGAGLVGWRARARQPRVEAPPTAA